MSDELKTTRANGLISMRPHSRRNESMAAYIDSLKGAIRQLHGCESAHIESVAIVEKFRDQTVWSGAVEIFSLGGHPQSDRCFAWSYDDGDKERFVALLSVPPINSPIAAVRTAIVADRDKLIFGNCPEW